MSLARFALMGLAGLVFSANLALAQAERRTEVRAEGTVHRSSMVIGGTVALQDGYRLGKIEDFIFDDGGCVSMVVVTYGDDYIAVPWSIAEFDFNKRSLVLNVERARLRDIPTFRDFKVFGTGDFRGRVDKFFGVTQRSNRSGARDDDNAPRPKAAQPGTGTTPRQPGTTNPGTTPRPGANPTTPPRDTQPGGATPRKGSGDSGNPGTKPAAPKAN